MNVTTQRAKINFHFSKNAWLEIFIVIIAFFFYGRYAFMNVLWDDELAIMVDAINSPSIFSLFRELQWELHAPGCWVLMYIFHSLSWDAPFIIRIPSILIAAAGLVALFRISQRYMPARWCFIFSLFCMTLPTVTQHATEVRPHIFLFSFGLWILHFLQEASFSHLDEIFFKNVKKALLVFTLSVFFHFGSFFILVVFFFPFFILYREKFFVSKDIFLGKARIVTYPLVAILFFDALYLFNRNLSSVMWSDLHSDVPRRMLSYVIQSFAYHHSLTFSCFVISLVIIFYRLLRNEYERGLKYLAIVYLWALVLIAAIEAAGFPSSRAKYSLYLLPITTLLLVKGIYLFKGNRVSFIFAQILLGAILFLNVTHPDMYTPFNKAEELISTANQVLNSNPENKLLLFGAQRNLTYYLKRIPLAPEKTLDCGYDENCLLNQLHEGKSKFYILTYHSEFQNPELRKLYSHTILKDTYGRLIEVASDE